MKLIENMTLSELEKELEKNTDRLERTNKKINAIHEKKDYSDELAKSFHLGKVGFRKDTKRQNQTLEKAIKNGVEATKLYQERSDLESLIKKINDVILYIKENDKSLTKAEIIAKKKDEIKDVEWTRENGGYRHGDWFVKKVDDTVFVYKNGDMKFWKKTVKEAKKLAAFAIMKNI